MSDQPPADSGWADKPANKRRVRIALYAVCLALIVVELLIDRHTYNSVESAPVFYALYGFAALVFAVALAKGLRALVRRDEGYYDS